MARFVLRGSQVRTSTTLPREHGSPTLERRVNVLTVSNYCLRSHSAWRVHSVSWERDGTDDRMVDDFGQAAIPIVALLLGITVSELQSRAGIPVLLKKRDLLHLNDIGVYLQQLAKRVEQAKGRS